MDVIFLFLDESVDLDCAWLTGVLVPAARYPHVRDAMIRIARAAVRAAGGHDSCPIELHGAEMLRDERGIEDEHRLRVFSEIVALVNDEQLEVLSVGHVSAKDIRKNLDELNMDPGDKLHTLNFQEMIRAIDLPTDALLVPIFDGVPGRKIGAKRVGAIDGFAYDAFMLGGSVTHWNRITLEDRPVAGIQHQANLSNFAEPTFADSAHSPLLQLADVVGYLLGVADRVERAEASEWKRRVAEVGRRLDSELVHRVSVSISFQKPVLG